MCDTEFVSSICSGTGLCAYCGADWGRLGIWLYGDRWLYRLLDPMRGTAVCCDVTIGRSCTTTMLAGCNKDDGGLEVWLMWAVIGWRAGMGLEPRWGGIGPCWVLGVGRMFVRFCGAGDILFIMCWTCGAIMCWFWPCGLAIILPIPPSYTTCPMLGGGVCPRPFARNGIPRGGTIGVVSICRRIGLSDRTLEFSELTGLSVRYFCSKLAFLVTRDP